MSRVTCDTEVIELSSDDSMSMFDAVTREAMDLSGEEFLRRWDAGEWQHMDLDDVPGLVDVWMFLPAVR